MSQICGFPSNSCINFWHTIVLSSSYHDPLHKYIFFCHTSHYDDENDKIYNWKRSKSREWQKIQKFEYKIEVYKIYILKHTSHFITKNNIFSDSNLMELCVCVCFEIMKKSVIFVIFNQFFSSVTLQMTFEEA